jgi:Immunity protein Imm1
MTHASGSDGHMTTVSWADDEKAPVRTVEELDARLDALDEQAREGEPLIAEIVRPDGAVLTIGLGRDSSVLNYSASLDPPYYTSHSDDSPEDENVVFYYYGHWSEFLPEMAVPKDDAREAARLFFSDGERPNNVGWRLD